MRRIKQRLISAVAALSLLVSAIPTIPIQANSLSADVTEPFHSGVQLTLPNGTATSSSYRIPAMVTLSNGTIVAAADIRWNTTYDGGGLDTITARSTDGGVNWNYTVANYLGDNGNTYNGKSTAFIDPCLVANGNTVYMLVDLYPYGVALNGSGHISPVTGTGFNSQGHLLLSDDSHATYGYYLNLNDYFIYKADGTPTGIHVDSYFNYTIQTATFGLTRPEETTEATEPSTEATEPSTEATAPSTEATEPSTEATEPSTEATEPSTEATEPSTEATEPSTEATEPPAVPTEPTTVPTDPTEPSLRHFLDGFAVKASAAEYAPDENIAPAAEVSYNLFCENSPYKVMRTGYLYLTKSTDAGATWSAPELLDCKMTNGEQVCLVGPGRGITTSTGRMVIPIYSYNNGTQKMGFLSYSNSTGWSRINAGFNTPWSSESAVVELSNGKLRFFFRNGSAKLYYVDYTFGVGWSSPVSTGIATNSNTQISAITYSQKLDGKQVILVSCPAGPEGGSAESGADYRKNGRIFVFTDDGSTMSLKNTVNVTENGGSFMYSCLTERSDGSVAILYEDQQNGWGINCSYEMEMKAYTASQLGITSGGVEGGEGGSEGGDATAPSGNQTITLSVGQQTSRTISGVAATPGTYTTEDAVAQYSIAYGEELTHQDSTANRGTDAYYTGETVSLHQALYTFTGDNTNGFSVQNGSVYLGNLTATTKPAGYPGTASNDEKQVFVKSGYTRYGANAFNIKLAGSERYLYFYRNGTNRFDKQGSAAKETAFLIYTPVDGSHTSSTELPGYYQITSADQILSGGKYLIAAKVNGSYYIMYPSTSTTDYYAHVVKATGTPITCTEQPANTVVTFTGLKTGQTSVVIGDTEFTVTVNAPEKSLDKHMKPNTVMDLDPMAELGITDGDCTVTYECTSGADVAVDTTGRVTVGSTEGTAVIVAKVMKDTVLYGTVTYTVKISEIIIEKTLDYFLPVGGKAIASNLTGELITTELKTNIATVDPGTAAATMNITISGVSEGDTSVIVGTTRINIHVVPSNSDPNTKSLSPSVNISIDEIENCEVFYSINGSKLYQIKSNGILINQTFYGGINISFYAAPNPGYALTLMTATDSLDNYYTLNYEGDISNSPAWPLEADGETYKSDNGFRWSLIQYNLTKERLKETFDKAIAKGCHGAQTFTRNDNRALTTQLAFRAEKLPEFTKEIVGYKRSGAVSDEDQANGKLNVSGYTEYFVFKDDVKLAFGDSLLYKFTVKSTSSTVEYTNVSLKDTRIKYSKENISVAEAPAAYEFYAPYTIKPEDVSMYSEGKFVNHAELSYGYSSQYSSGTYGGNASSEATCDIVGIVSYAWIEGTPEAIVKNTSGSYTLPDSFSLNMYTDFNISPYAGAKTHTENVDGIDVTWVYTEEWGAQRYVDGAMEDTITWFPVSNALNQNFQMQHSRSITFYGRWLASYSVVYEWDGEHPENVTLPAITKHQEGASYLLDGTYQVNDTYDDGTYTWTFQGWKLRGSDEVITDPDCTMGSGHDFYIGSWTKSTNASRLTIHKTGCSDADENQSFLFHISGNGLTLDVVIHGNGSVAIDGLTVGAEYIVTEKTSWSWRYQPEQTAKRVIIAAAGNTLTFDNTRNKSNWFSGGAWCDNQFAETN